jgi:bifunctional non-homologous end joining protein LigD
VAFDLLWLNGADLRPLPLLERRWHLQNIPTEESASQARAAAIISEALSVTGRGHKLFELMCANDLEGIVAKRLKDPYEPRARWLKIKNRGYSQNEGRRDLFDKVPGRPATQW